MASAKQLQAAKDKALDELIEASGATEVAVEELAARQRAESLKWSNAVKAGWSEKDLLAIGFDSPGSAKPARKTRAAKRTAPALPQPPATPATTPASPTE
jgi:hypothetical protein